MKYLITISLYLWMGQLCVAQNQIAFSLKDHQNQEPLIGVNVFIPQLEKGVVTDVNGMATFSDIPDGRYEITFSYIGYQSVHQFLTFPHSTTELAITMQQNTEDLGEIIVTSNRANRSVANIPSRVEVLTDEVEEAATMDPSKIAHLLMHTTGVQVQQTAATSGAASVRIQGQYGRYTQILKDGFPIYGGFTGGLSVLQIPPLDLRQVEFVKGATSTLYGGGAIAGLINLISKVPNETEELSLHVNLSHIGNTDLNSFYAKRSGKWGLTVFTSNNTNRVYDVDDDGFSDVPEVQKFNFNPKVFYYLDDKTTISLGGTFTNENRIGGDVQVVESGTTNAEHYYFERNKSQQITTQFKITHDLKAGGQVELKNSTNRFKRSLFLKDYAFSGTQFSTFSEVNYAIHKPKHSLIVGSNFYTDRFEEEENATPLLRNQNLVTFGVFAQHIWDFDEKLALETGLRTDYNTDYGAFFLPKMALIYKPSLQFTARIGGGLGYKLPTIFTEDAERLAFENVASIDKNIHKPEHSFGINTDFTYRIITTEQLRVSLIEYFFYNKLNQPLVLQSLADGTYQFRNSAGFFETKGIESTIKASAGDFHLYLGYTYVDAVSNDGTETSVLPLTPKHSFHGDLMFVQEGKWRMGIDAEYESTQILTSGRVVPSLFKAGFLIEHTINQLSVYINLENWTDTRQTQYESLVQPPDETPRFTEVWAPLDGFIFNAGVKIKL